MKPFHGVLFTVVIFLFFGCHKNDVAFEMENKTFADSVTQKQLFNKKLTQVIPSAFQSVQAMDIAKNRAEKINTYLAELDKMVDTSYADITHEQQLAFSSIEKLSAEDQKIRLIDLMVSTEEEILAFHIKASGYFGLKDQALRNWADEKVPFIQSNLAELQLLKNL